MTVPTLVSGLPDGPAGHGTVDPRRLDPGWSPAGRRAFAAAVARGDITVPDVENFDGDGPYGLDRGVAPLAYDLFAADHPTYNSNLASAGGFHSVQPYLSFEAPSDDTAAFVGRAARRLDRRLPEGYLALVTGSAGSDGLSLRLSRTGRAGGPFHEATRALLDDLADAHGVGPGVDGYETALSSLADGRALPAAYDLPTNDERASLDALFLGAVRATLSDH